MGKLSEQSPGLSPSQIWAKVVYDVLPITEKGACKLRYASDGSHGDEAKQQRVLHHILTIVAKEPAFREHIQINSQDTHIALSAVCHFLVAN